MLAVSAVFLSARQDNVNRIVLVPKNPIPNRPHRAPEFIPVDCAYDGFSRQVEIVFKSGEGESTVLLSNLVTGETATVTESGAVILVPVQSDGLYMVEITLSDGREYYGTFSTEEEDTE